MKGEREKKHDIEKEAWLYFASLLHHHSPPQSSFIMSDKTNNLLLRGRKLPLLPPRRPTIYPVPLSIANTPSYKRMKYCRALSEAKKKLTLIAKLISLSSTSHSFKDFFFPPPLHWTDTEYQSGSTALAFYVTLYIEECESVCGSGDWLVCV